MKLDCYLPNVTGLKQDDFLTSTSLVAKKEVAFTKQFPSCNILLRTFCVTRDMPVIGGWTSEINRACNMVAASYVYAGASDFARSFMVLANNQIPVCQVDISDAMKDELYAYYSLSAGDYILRLLMNPRNRKIGSLHIHSLQTCLEYLFQFAEIEQIIAQPEADNTPYNQLLLKTGFSFEDTLYSPYGVCNLYSCTRKSFQQISL